VLQVAEVVACDAAMRVFIPVPISGASFADGPCFGDGAVGVVGDSTRDVTFAKGDADSSIEPERRSCVRWF